MIETLSAAWQRFKQQSRETHIAVGVLVGLVAILSYSYLNALTHAQSGWSRGEYSHGWLVPLFSVFLLWYRFEPLGPVSAQERWIGLAALLAFTGVRAFAAYISVYAIDFYTFVPCALALVLMVGGWKMLKWAGPAVGFLIFMFPLSYKMEQATLVKAQRWAVKGSTYALQTLGVETYSVGEHIHVRDLNEQKYHDLMVVEACSGLRMTTVFLAMAVAVVFVIEIDLWAKILILLSGIPIALLVNIARITVTGILYLIDEHWAHVFHEYIAGFFMVPLALSMLALEIWIFRNLIIDDRHSAPVSVSSLGPQMKMSRPSFPSAGR